MRPTERFRSFVKLASVSRVQGASSRETRVDNTHERWRGCPKAIAWPSWLASWTKCRQGTAEHFEGAHFKSWDDDEWARGAASWYRPGQMTALWPHVATPEGRVHFAGDHTSAWMHWMQGALQSGFRAASEVHDATGGPVAVAIRP